MRSHVPVLEVEASELKKQQSHCGTMTPLPLRLFGSPGHVPCAQRVRLFATPWTRAHEASHLWDFPDKNTGVDCPFLLQRISLTQGLNLRLLCLLHCRQILYSLSHREEDLQDCSCSCLVQATLGRRGPHIRLEVTLGRRGPHIRLEGGFLASELGTAFSL